MNDKSHLTAAQKIKIQQEYIYVQSIPEVIEIPADILLYWIFKSIGFDKVVTDMDMNQYHDALCTAYAKYEDQLLETFALNFPFKENYHHELFEEIVLEDDKKGFVLRKVKGKREKELCEYRLARLEAFEMSQNDTVREIFLLAQTLYHKKFLEYHQEETNKPSENRILKSIKQKIFHM